MMVRPRSAEYVLQPGSFLYGWILVGLNLIISAVFWWQLPDQIPLFYSLPFGLAQLQSRQWFFLLPGLSVFLLFDYLLISRLMVSSSLFYSIIKWLHLLGLLLLTIALVHILIIVL
jgi:hypothetical protein